MPANVVDIHSYCRCYFIQWSTGMVNITNGKPVEWVEEPNYLFDLSKSKEQLAEWLVR
jgi:hypothetical protein